MFWQCASVCVCVCVGVCVWALQCIRFNQASLQCLHCYRGALHKHTHTHTHTHTLTHTHQQPLIRSVNGTSRLGGVGGEGRLQAPVPRQRMTVPPGESRSLSLSPPLSGACSDSKPNGLGFETHNVPGKGCSVSIPPPVSPG